MVEHSSLDKMQCGKAGDEMEDKKEYKTWLARPEILLKEGADVGQVRHGFD